MLFSVHALQSLAGTLALMSLLVVAYATVERASWRLPQVPWALGALFGIAAVLALHQPVQIGVGVQGDLRGVPIVLAGAYLGWPGAVAAASLAVAARLGIGGVGTAAGCGGILVNALAGLGWAWLTQRSHGSAPKRRGLRALLGLAALSSTHVLTALLLPSDLARYVATAIWPVLLPLHGVGVLVVGGLLERERTLLAGERRLAREADYDALTGLLNRRGFEAAVTRVRPEFTGSALLLLDLDRFKRINDVHGHAAGDAALQEFGARLTRALGDQGVLGRVGGEEAAAFLPSTLPREARRVAERLREAVRAEPFALPGGLHLPVTVSVGVACCPGAADLDALILCADKALYWAKDGGRDRCCLDGQPGPEASRGSVVSLAAARAATAA